MENKNIMIVGIDPGVNTGFATLLNSVYIVKTFDFWKTVNELRDLRITYGNFMRVYIEDPNLNKPVFQKKGADNHLKIVKVAQNVGSNKREASLLIEFCKLENIIVSAVQPVSHKFSADTIRRYTGIVKSNQHERDALKLIIGRD